MAKGIIYLMTTVVPGVVKIGCTKTDNFKNRMYQLESNGYKNITGLKREFAIEVDEYQEKERMIHEIFSKSRIGETEFFALKLDIIKYLLSSLNGVVIYSKDNKKELFKEIIENKQDKIGIIPDGYYTFNRKVYWFGEVKGKAKVENGIFTLLKGSVCADVKKGKKPSVARRNAKIKDNILQEDIICNSPTTAAIIVSGTDANGWTSWKDSQGNFIDEYRKK